MAESTPSGVLQSIRKPRDNSHPTVKPTDLMRHLIRLVTPSRNEDGDPGLVLDPFLGSGSTAIACELEGFRWIGIEQSEEYVKIAEARLNGIQRGLGLDVPAPTRTMKLPSGGGPAPVVDPPQPPLGFTDEAA
jgi:DNA modification methylase